MIHPPSWFGDVCLIFVSLLIQGIPFLLIGALAGGFVTTFVPLTAVIRGWPKHPLLSAWAGTLFGFLLPSCDCAVVPVVRRLLQKGIPLSAGVAYLIAAPTLNPLCLISTFLAYQMAGPWHMLLWRTGGSAVLAVLVGLLASRFNPGSLLRGEILLSDNATGGAGAWMQIDPRLVSFRRRLAVALGMALTDFLNVSTLYVIGALCSALLQIFVPLGRILVAHGNLSVPMAMLLGFMLSLCSTADAFVVNAFGALGLKGQLAFLWLGPVYNLRTLFVYRNIFSYRAIAGLGLAVVLLILGMTFFVGK